MKLNKYITLPIGRVFVELNNTCNLNCEFCPYHLMTRKKINMDFNLVKKILDELQKKKIAEVVLFHLMGEPLLYPKIFETIDYAQKKKKINVRIDSNGSLLNNNNIEKLSHLNFYELLISYQTPDEKSFRYKKSQLSLSEFQKQILNLIKVFLKNKSKTKIIISFLLTGHKKIISHNFDIINTRKELHRALINFTKKIYKIIGEQNKADLNKVLKNLKKTSINKWNLIEIFPNIFFETKHILDWGIKKKKYNANHGYCGALVSQFAILSNGDFVLCCLDYNGETKIGNVKDNSIIELLNSKKSINIIKNFKRFRVIHPFCKKCLGSNSLIPFYSKQILSILLKGVKNKLIYKKKKIY